MRWFVELVRFLFCSSPRESSCCIAQTITGCVTGCVTGCTTEPRAGPPARGSASAGATGQDGRCHSTAWAGSVRQPAAAWAGAANAELQLVTPAMQGCGLYQRGSCRAAAFGSQVGSRVGSSCGCVERRFGCRSGHESTPIVAQGPQKHDVLAQGCCARRYMLCATLNWDLIGVAVGGINIKRTKI